MQHPGEPIAEKAFDPPGILLSPTLPSLLTRYDRPISTWIEPLTDAVPPNTRLLPKSGQIGAGWTEHTNPEGDNYFEHGQRRIVTYTDVRVPSIEQKILSAHDHLVELGRSRDPQIANYEVYIHVMAETPAVCKIEYYFVDHHARHPFWLHGVRMQDLGLGGFETWDHLRAALTPEFYTHKEYFPVHQPFDQASENELIAIFRHGCADDMTSFGSTFPYGAQECLNHLRTLEGFVASGGFSSYRTAVFARLWGSISRVRHINGYSLPRPRVDRLQGLEAFKGGQKSDLYLRVLVTLSLALPLSKFGCITELWNGRVVYQRHWYRFLDEQQKEWMHLAVLSLVVFVGGVIFICASGPKPLAVASASVSFASVMSALGLYQSYSRSRFKTASDISSWISALESSRSGLLPLAIKFTVPQTTAIYSAFFLLMALLMLAADGLRESDSINSAMLLAAAFAPAIVVYLMLRVDTWNGASDSSEQLFDAREPGFDGLDV